MLLSYGSYILQILFHTCMQENRTYEYTNMVTVCSQTMALLHTMDAHPIHGTISHFSQSLTRDNIIHRSIHSPYMHAYMYYVSLSLYLSFCYI